MKSLLSKNYVEDRGIPLQCPLCGSEALHHDYVEIFDRSEDQAYGLHILLEGGTAIVNTSLNGNPSPRRHGLVIGLYCEPHQHRSALTIVQHKGTTYFDLQPAASF